MQIVLDEKYCAKSSVLALGMFDGVHIGHRVLLERAAHLAKERNVPLVVCTFQQHPLQVIAPEKCPPMLSTFEERNQLMEAMGVDVLCAMPFTRDVMDMLPEEYVGQLVRRFHTVAVVCGYNHTFGRKGQGTPALLDALGAESKNVLTPAYYDQYLKSKGTRDNDSEEMLDIIFDSMTYDIGYLYNFGELGGMVLGMVNGYQTDLASRYAKYESKAVKAIEKMVTAFQDME